MFETLGNPKILQKKKGLKEYARKLVKRLEREGKEDPSTLQKLGNCYFQGFGVKQDHEKAVALFRASASKGHFLGEYNLGKCYQDGIGGV